LPYIEDENGNIPDKHQCAEIRRHAKELFQTLVAQKMAPHRWGSVSSDAKAFFRQGIYREYPHLRYGEGHWKVDKLATESYSGFRRDHP
ncbi:hypothetical protein BV25DRAFT_1763290, partial [Artomyces pyxidatus]